MVVGDDWHNFSNKSLISARDLIMKDLYNSLNSKKVMVDECVIEVPVLVVND